MKDNRKTPKPQTEARRNPKSSLLRPDAFVQRLNGMFRVKAKRVSFDPFFLIGSLVLGHRTPSLIRAIRHFVLEAKRLSSKSGIKFLVKYLKACHVLTMQSAAGFKIPASQRLGVAVARTKGGLPTLIPL
jgi:hypothetical protein